MVFSSNLLDSLRCFKDMSYSTIRNPIMKAKIATARKNNTSFLRGLSEKRLRRLSEKKLQKSIFFSLEFWGFDFSSTGMLFISGFCVWFAVEMLSSDAFPLSEDVMVVASVLVSFGGVSSDDWGFSAFCWILD